MHTNDGRWRQFQFQSKKVASNNLLLVENLSKSTLHSRDSPQSTKENDLYIQNHRPRFEPATFLIHDLRTDALDRSATVGRLGQR